MLGSEDRAALESILGAPGLILDPPAMAGYGAAARYGGGAPAGVLRPRTTEEVSKVVAYCIRRRLPYVPQSGNTGLVLGSTPDVTGDQLVISLERMTGVLAVDLEDRTARVSAGVRLSALNAALEPHGLFLPIDLGADPMLGGMAATNTGGARFLRYGDMRRHILGLEVVLPDREGTVLSLSDGLRKDSSSLPLRHVFIGSFGALGVITGVTLEVHRRPTAASAALLIPHEGAILDLLAAVETAAGEALTAFEGMSGAAMSRALANVPGLGNPFPKGQIPAYAVLIELTRSAPLREREPTLDDDLEAILVDIAARPASPLADALIGPADRLWALRHALSEGLRAEGPVIGFDLAFRRSAVFPFRAAAAARVAAEFPEFEVCDFGHIADGGLHFNLVPREPGPVEPARLAALRDCVHSLAVEGFGGSFSGEHGLGRANQDAYDRYVPPRVKSYSAALANVFAQAPVGALRLGPRPGDSAC